jgi:hypothetical protein
MMTGLDTAAAPTPQQARQMLDAIGGSFWCVYIGGACSSASGWSAPLIRNYAATGINAFLPLYVGQQLGLRCPHTNLTADQGHQDGKEAVTLLKSFGWTAAVPCALDIERSTSDANLAGALAYADGFCVALREVGYVPGVYGAPDFLTRLAQEANRPSFVFVASWVRHGADHSLDPQSIPGLPDDIWTANRVWQYAGAFDSIPLQVLGVDVDIDVANMPLAPAPTNGTVGGPGHLIAACALKIQPNHTCAALAHAPANARIMVLPWQATTNGELWQRVRWTDKEGWLPASNVASD